MRKFLLKIQYNGKNYGGWQYNDGVKTVQGEVEKALSSLFGVPVSAEGSSRTDAGVSAIEYPLCFCADTKLPVERVPYKLNRFLPNDIQAFYAEEVPLSFNLRKQIVSKTYRYKFYSSPFLFPVLGKDALRVKEPLDLSAMRSALDCLIGKHDLSAFTSKGGDGNSNIKTIYSASLTEENGIYSLYITASGFPYNGVRIIAGTLIEVGKKANPSLLSEVLLSKKRENAGATLPPKALTLIKTEIKY